MFSLLTLLTVSKAHTQLQQCYVQEQIDHCTLCAYHLMMMTTTTTTMMMMMMVMMIMMIAIRSLT